MARTQLPRRVLAIRNAQPLHPILPPSVTSRARVVLPLLDRSVLTDAQVDFIKTEMRARYNWDSDPRPFQVDGVKAQLEGHDAIIQAPAGSGKTAIVAGPYIFVWHI